MGSCPIVAAQQFTEDPPLTCWSGVACWNIVGSQIMKIAKAIMMK